MRTKRAADLATGVFALVVVVGVVLAVQYAERVPRPDVSLPSGDRVVSVTGTCWGGGSEYFMCAGSEGGVRSLLTVRTARSRTQGEPLLREALRQDGYVDAGGGLDTKGFSTHGVAVDRPVSYCRPRADCIALVNWSGADEYLLAWVRR